MIKKSLQEPPLLHRQRGATLIVALIILVLLTMMAITSLNLGESNLRIVANEQNRAESMAVAQEAIEVAISSTRFMENASSVYATPCSAANTYCKDVNADGNNDVVVTLSPPPRCVTAKYLKNTDLNLLDKEELGCVVSTRQSFGVADTTTDTSLCADAIWEVNAVAEDATTKAKVTVSQGVKVRAAIDYLAETCPAS